MRRTEYLKLLNQPPTEQQAFVDRYRWLHSIDFGNGVVTKGSASLDETHARAAALLGGLQLDNKTVLDVGAWNGAYSFAAKRKGALRVLAVDKFCWVDEALKGRDTFEIGCALTGLDVEALEIDIPEVSPRALGVFNVVVFSGVFYHLFDPIHSTAHIAECASDLLIVETHQDLLDNARPGMIMYAGGALNNDPTNWWGPNPQAVYEILHELGFAVVYYSDTPGFDDPTSSAFRQRGIFHAFRDYAAVHRLVPNGLPDAWRDLEDPQARKDIFQPRDPARDALIAENLALRQHQRELQDKLQRSALLAREVELLRNERRLIHRSKSWRLTAPLRKVSRAFNKKTRL